MLLHQRECPQGSSVGCFVANPSALIAVSPLRPQSKQHVAVQNLYRGQGNAKRKNRGFLIIQKQAVVRDCTGREKDVNLYLVSGGINQLDLSVQSMSCQTRTTLEKIYFTLLFWFNPKPVCLHSDIYQKQDPVVLAYLCTFFVCSCTDNTQINTCTPIIHGQQSKLGLEKR